MADYVYTPSAEILAAKNKTNPSEIEVIGILATPYMVHKEIESGVISTSNLTQTTTFPEGSWFQIDADKCRVKLTNSTGDAQYLTECSIRGKLVYRLSGAQGYTHDYFSNYDDILRNGEKQFKLQNNMIFNLAQINSLADFWWKFYKTKKHIYRIKIFGTRHWYKIGNWYTLQIGGAGEAEYIDSTVILTEKTVEAAPGSVGWTTLTFREVEENWKFDSTAVARFIASGLPARLATKGNVVSVGAYDYCGDANYLCDGTDDQVEIQAAIDFLTETYGGGTIHLTRGTFNITAAIELESNIVLEGEGAQTILDRNCNDYCIEAIGTLGAEKENIYVSNMYFTCTDTNTIEIIRFDYVYNAIIGTCIFVDCYYCPIYMAGGDTFQITNNTISGLSRFGITSNASTGIISDNIIEIYNTDTVFAIYVLGSNRYQAVVSGNIIQNCYSYTDRVTGILLLSIKNGSIRGNEINNLMGEDGTKGIHLSGATNSVIDNNRITDVVGLDNADTNYAIYIDNGSNNSVVTNYCLDNGNLISYGQCESATPPQVDGNTATNTSAARDATVAYWGTYSYKITKTNAAGTGASYWFVDNNTTTDLHGVTKKQGTYTLKMMVYVPSTGGPAAAEVRAVVSEYDGSWNDTTDAMAAQDTWTELECSVTIDSGSTGFRCGIEFLSTAAVNEFIYIDNVRLIPGGIANEHSNNFYDTGTNTILG